LLFVRNSLVFYVLWYISVMKWKTRHRLVVLAVILLLPLNSCETENGTESVWVKSGEAPFGGFYGNYASDPHVIKVEDTFWMYYSEYDPAGEGPEDDRTGIARAVSTDGRSWTITAGTTPTFVLQGVEDSGEEKLETVFCLQRDGGYWLYYGGYVRGGVEIWPGGEVIDTMGSALYLATSTDGVNFERHAGGPVLVSTPGGYDEDAIFSPSIIPYQEGWLMVYTGHRYVEDGPSGVFLLAALSDDGIVWTKQQEPLLQAYPDRPWMKDGAAESDLFEGPDGRFYLFFTGLEDGTGGEPDTRTIGLAMADNPLGPYTVQDEPVVRPGPDEFDGQAVLAPDVFLDDGTLFLWYNAVPPGETAWRTGRAEHPWPLFP
jgi:hypothetical protein